MAIDINIPIEDAVVDGSLNPVTSNAVFDALALKANSADLATVATTGDYNDLDNLPTIPAAQVNADWNATSGVAEILNKPTIPSIAGLVPDTRNLTINGTTYDLSADRSWVIAATASTLQHEVKAGEAMTKGQAVYVSSADGTNMVVSKASNATEATSSKTMGLIIQNLAINGQGFVITEGLLAGLNTSSSTAGDPVWLGTNGNLIYGLINKPAAPAHLVFIGIVTRANVSNGEIFVRVQNGFELQELHNVAISSLTDGQTLTYESATSLWKNTTPATGITIGTTAITSGTDGRVLFQSGGVVQQDSTLFWDNTNKRLGIGATPASTVRLDVRAQGALSTDIALRARNSANNLNILQVNGDNSIYMLGDGDAGAIRLSKQTGHSTLLQHRSSNVLPSIFTIAAYAQGGSVGQIKLDALTGDGTTPALTVSRLISGVTDLTGVSLYSAFGTNATCFVMKNASGYVGLGTNPNAVVDHFSMYSADQTAGNAAPHFRTENGNIIKLYQQSSAGITTVAQLVTVMQNLGLLS